MKKITANVSKIMRLIVLVLLFEMSFFVLNAQTVIQIGEVYNFTQSPASTENYQIDLPQAGEFTIHINNWISTLNWSLDYDRLYIYNSENIPIDRNDFSTVEDPFLFHMFQGNEGLVFRVGQAGTYTIAVHSGQRWGDTWGTTTMQNYEMSVTAIYCSDTYEINDTISMASPISIGATITAYQWRGTNTSEVWGDEDWYMVNVETPGRLKIELVDWVAIYNWSADYDRLWVYNGEGVSIGFAGGNDFYSWMMGGGTLEEPVVIEMNLAHAGNYYLRFHAGWATSLTPYQLTTSFTQANDLFEPNDDFATAKAIPSAEVWHQAYEWRSLDNTMNVGDDEDFFYFEAAGAGEFSLSLEGWIPIYNWGANYDRLYIYDADENPVGDSPCSWMMGTDPINFTVPAEGKYYIQLHCGSSYSIDGYQFKLSGSFAGIWDEEKAQANFQAYPNPASDAVIIEIDQVIKSDFTLNIYNLSGELIHSELMKQNKQGIDVGHLSDGFYFVEIDSKKWSGKQKLIIQR
jgi:hypothetical protein